MKEVGLFFLIKGGEKKYMFDLYEHGLIFMSNINYFRQYECDKSRRDKDEGLTGVVQIDKIKLFYKSKVLGHSNSAQLKLHDYENKGNLYCLIAITSLEDPETFKIDEKNKEFGDYFVVITDVGEFIKRIGDKFKVLGLEYEYSLVDYYNRKEYSGPLNVFHKPDDFRHQKEFRFWVKRNDTDSLKFSIGSIEDISFILDKKKLDKISIKRSKF